MFPVTLWRWRAARIRVVWAPLPWWEYNAATQNLPVARITRAGAGKLLLEAVEAKAIENQSGAVSLNVNRFNKAQTFYEKLKHGFEIVGEEDINIGLGYLMEDYKLLKKL